MIVVRERNDSARLWRQATLLTNHVRNLTVFTVSGDALNDFTNATLVVLSEFGGLRVNDVESVAVLLEALSDASQFLKLLQVHIGIRLKCSIYTAFSSCSMDQDNN